jgi:2-methylcitrate dehydratase PrpD
VTVVARLARFVIERSWDDLSEAACVELKVRVLDAVGCALGAFPAQPLDDLGAPASGAPRTPGAVYSPTAVEPVEVRAMLSEYSSMGAD